MAGFQGGRPEIVGHALSYKPKRWHFSFHSIQQSNASVMLRYCEGPQRFVQSTQDFFENTAVSGSRTIAGAPQAGQSMTSFAGSPIQIRGFILFLLLLLRQPAPEFL